MVLLSACASSDFSQITRVPFPVCPCKIGPRRAVCLNGSWDCGFYLLGFHRSKRRRCFGENLHKNVSRNWVFRACAVSSDGGGTNFNVDIANSARRGAKSIVLSRFSDGFDNDDDASRDLSQESIQLGSGFNNFQQDPIVDKLRTQLGVIHPIPSPPINRTVFSLFVFFFFVGVVFDKVWTRLKRKKSDAQLALWRQTPLTGSMFFEKDLQRKESVEWVNMVLGKLWQVYRPGLENWIIGLLQPVIDNIEKPDYVERVEVKQFSLGDEPLSVRSVERRTSRRVNDLQYQIGLRYTGGARMLLMLSLKFGILPIMVPVGVRDFDIDGELWVKLRLIPTEPWVGAVSWAFVDLPKIAFELSPFRLFNLMAIPVLSTFLIKLLTEDLPRLFVRPKKIVLDFQKGEAVGPVPTDLKSGDAQEKNKDSVGELSVTLVDARDLSYVLYGKTDPYVILRLGDQIIRSKKNSQTTVIGPPGEPIWNQDFNMLVADPQKQKLYVEVVDSLGFAYMTTGTGEVDLSTLQDTVPTDKIVVLTGGWNLFRKRKCGELLLRLTYKAYVEDEEDEGTKAQAASSIISDDDGSDADEPGLNYKQMSMGDKESFMDVLAALIVSEEFQGIVTSETGNTKVGDDVTNIGSTSPKSQGIAAESVPSGVDGAAENSKGSALFWLAVITSVAVVIALNVGGSSIFNP
ncbi:tricalbin-3-like [Chenopodium quinoa]|uniref:tricalbin-3-like n=1 Tax=Chenopodium quinoa TaxID=63459 RepID=UPI000B798529|nr:tricalbin-3-like [Chenopodium quinoa]XP_021735377.1 tricalbin-3-like [Chenopodium quinoa]XP_021735378.1 tricalbin-3-like [Chenopodium quinoa]